MFSRYKYLCLKRAPGLLQEDAKASASSPLDPLRKLFLLDGGLLWRRSALKPCSGVADDAALTPDVRCRKAYWIMSVSRGCGSEKPPSRGSCAS